MDLGNQMRQQSMNLEVDEILDKVVSLTKENDLFTIETRSSETFHTENVLIAHSTQRCTLNLEGEKI